MAPIGQAEIGDKVIVGSGFCGIQYGGVHHALLSGKMKKGRERRCGK
jgi:hypothetical protein